MEALVGFQVGFWDYVTFAAIFVIVVAGLVVAVFILGLPGRIDIARNHPEADAIYVMGWVGFLAIVPWIQAFIWAFKPTTVVDIRYMPKPRRARSRLPRSNIRKAPETSRPCCLRSRISYGRKTVWRWRMAKSPWA